jgi:predicted RNA binding protein YcfA (HicA-like mRNA interferase family)
MKFEALIRLLEENGFEIIKQKGSIRYYGKTGWNRLIRLDYHGSKEVPNGTGHAIVNSAGIKKA